MKDWKTTLAGIAAILAGALLLYKDNGSLQGAGLCAVGIGLIKAADAK